MNPQEKTTALAVQGEKPAYAIAPAPPGLMPRSLEDAVKFGEIMFRAGAFPDLKTAQQATVKIIAGAALGYDPVTAMNAYHLIEGKLCPSAGEIAARIKRSHRYNFKTTFIDKNGNPIRNLSQEVHGCQITFFERFNDKWEEIGQSIFTKDDAITAGIYGKAGPRGGPGVWKAYFRNMAYSRALTNGSRWYCPDVFGGPVYTAEELGAEVTIGPDGDVQLVELPPSAASDDAPKDPREGQRPPGKAELERAYAKARELHADLPEALREFIASEFPDFPRNDKGQVVMRTGTQAWEVWDKLEALVQQPAPADDGIVVEGELLENEPPQPQTSEAAETLKQIDASLNLPITESHREHLIIMFRDRQYTDANRHAFCTAHVKKKSLAKGKTEFTEADYIVVRRELEKVPIPPKPPAAQGELL